MSELERAAELVRGADHVLVLTGAGVSKESGIPTFREPGGFWDEYDIEELATLQGFRADPEKVWKWYDWRREQIAECDPNPGHFAIAELEQWCGENGRGFALVTQNIDNLHGEAGSEKTIELHGNLAYARKQGTPPSAETIKLPPPPLDEHPPHDEDGDMLRPHVVWFGEQLDPEIIRRAEDQADRADLVLVVGTSNAVYPSASLPYQVQRQGGEVIEVNPNETELSRDADLCLRGPSGELMPGLMELVRSKGKD